jgi:hypothetical protein
MTKRAANLPNITLREFKVKPDEKTGEAQLYYHVVMKAANWDVMPVDEHVRCQGGVHGRHSLEAYGDEQQQP